MSAEGFQPTLPYEAIDLAPFRHLPEACWSAELYHVDALIEAVVSRHCRDLLESIPAQQVHPDRRAAYAWLGRRVAQSPEVLGSPVGEGPTFDLIQLAYQHYPAWLRGQVEAREVLFSRSALALWEAYFDNANPSYAPVNRLGAAAVAGLAADPKRILEVGAGCGSGTEALLDELAGQINSYCATDVSPVFLSRARQRLGQRYPVPIQFQRLDLNLPSAAQSLEHPEQGYDLIYAVNTLHTVRDLLFSLRELGGLLSSDGTLALVEGVRPQPQKAVAIEFLFQLTPEFHSIRTDPQFRPSGGFLYHGAWRVALALAGFSSVQYQPDMSDAITAYPSYSMAAILAQR